MGKGCRSDHRFSIRLHHGVYLACRCTACDGAQLLSHLVESPILAATFEAKLGDTMRLTALLLGALTLAGATAAGAQGYPNKPIRMVVTFPSGGAPDTPPMALL